MRKYLLIVLAMAGASAPAQGAYSYYRTLTIDHVKVGTAVLTYSDFPVIVSTTDISLSTRTGLGGRLNSTGYDIGFSTKDTSCSFLLNWDTETYNASTGELKAWVKIPQISSSTDTSFYMCYGDAGVTSYQGASTMTWSNGYKSVWHLADNLATTNVYDATRANDVTNQSNTVNKSTTGQVSTGLLYNGSSDYSSSAGTNLSSIASSFTVSGWLYRNGTSPSGEFYMGKGRGGSDGWSLYTAGGTHNFVKLGVAVVATSIPSSLNTWEYIVWTLDVDKFPRLFKDGTLVFTSSDANALSNPTNEFALGGPFNGVGAIDTTALWNGRLDEMRFSNVIRSDGWIKTEYNNQSNPATFMTISAEASSGSPASTTVYKKRVYQL